MKKDYSDELFWEQVASDSPTLLAFWSHNCPPCQVMAPVFERAGKHFRDRIEFVAVNTYDRPDIAGRFGVKSTPTLILVRRSKALRHFYGLIRESVLRQHLEPYAPAAGEDRPRPEKRSLRARLLGSDRVE